MPDVQRFSAVKWKCNRCRTLQQENIYIIGHGIINIIKNGVFMSYAMASVK